MMISGKFIFLALISKDDPIQQLRANARPTGPQHSWKESGYSSTLSSFATLETSFTVNR